MNPQIKTLYRKSAKKKSLHISDQMLESRISYRPLFNHSYTFHCLEEKPTV